MRVDVAKSSQLKFTPKDQSHNKTKKLKDIKLFAMESGCIFTDGVLFLINVSSWVSDLAITLTVDVPELCLM